MDIEERIREIPVGKVFLAEDLEGVPLMTATYHLQRSQLVEVVGSRPAVYIRVDERQRIPENIDGNVLEWICTLPAGRYKVRTMVRRYERETGNIISPQRMAAHIPYASRIRRVGATSKVIIYEVTA